jgi:putative ABC transport system permease protein
MSAQTTGFSPLIGPRWRKVLADVWSNKTRTALVVLSIAIGVFAIGLVNGTRAILERELNSAYRAINPMHASINASGIDDAMVEAIRRTPGVRDASASSGFTVRVQIGPDKWRELALTALPDYNNIRINKVRPEQGAWPPPEREFVIERSSLPPLNAKVGDTVLVELRDGKQKQVRIAGTVYNLNLPPIAFVNNSFGYISFDTLEWLGGSRDYNEISIVVNGNVQSKADIEPVVRAVRDKIERSGNTVGFVYLPEPNKHPADQGLQPLLLLLNVLGIMSLLASGFLVVNTIAALLTQQTRQIGVMKAIGARGGQLAAMYMATALLFGLLALLVGVPLAWFGAGVFARMLGDLVNNEIANTSVPANVLLLQVAVGLVAPVAAALVPVFSGVRVTVRQAISSYGLGQGRFGRGRIDRFLERIRGLSRPLMLSLRNTFRRKGRLALTLTTLTLSGLIFVGVFSVRESLLLTLDDALKYFNYDVGISFNRSFRIDQIEREALQIPGVIAAESWGFNSTRRLRPDDTESDNLVIIAPPAETKMLAPTIIEGRWLLPGDESAVVLNTNTTRLEPDLKVGSELTLKFNGRESTWRIVGLVKGIGGGPFVYINYPYYAQTVREVGRAGSVQLVTSPRDAATQARVAKAAETHFNALGMRVGSVQTIAELRAQNESLFNIIVIFLMVMAVLLAVVGGLGLMGTMSINVIERTREIGVMRAIGASDGAVLKIVIVEGVLIGAISWLLGALLALPVSKLLSDAVGVSFFQTPLSYRFSLSGALIWLALVVLLAAVASYLPARNASRLTVRDVLAYEG